MVVVVMMMVGVVVVVVVVVGVVVAATWQVRAGAWICSFGFVLLVWRYAVLGELIKNLSFKA